MIGSAGAFGGGDDEEERNEDGELVSVVEARKEAEEKRRQKHQQMEAEREEIRQGIRDKVLNWNVSYTKLLLAKLFITWKICYDYVAVFH